MIDLAIIFLVFAGIFILLPNVLSFHANDRQALSNGPRTVSDLAKVPSKAGAPTRVANLLSFTH